MNAGNARIGTENARVHLYTVCAYFRTMFAHSDDIRKHSYILTPDRYIGTEAAEDDGEPFENKMKRLTATLREQQKEAAKLDAVIAANLKELEYGG